MGWILFLLLSLTLMVVGVKFLTEASLPEEVDEGLVVAGDLEEEVGRQVGVMVGQVVKQHLAGCHLVLATATTLTQYSPVFYHVLRYLAAEEETGLVVEMGSLLSQGGPAAQDLPSHDHLLQGLWGDGSSTCHALILDITGGDTHSTVRVGKSVPQLLFFAPLENMTISFYRQKPMEHKRLFLVSSDYFAFSAEMTPRLHVSRIAVLLTFRHAQYTPRFLEWSRLWLRPETSVIVVGGKPGVEDVLHHPSLRNTLHAFYISFHRFVPNTRLRNRGPGNLFQGPGDLPSGRMKMEMYRRCLYCSGGEAGVQLLHRWELGSGLPKNFMLFPTHPENFMGHEFRVITKNYFPYISYDADSGGPGAVVSLQDSLNTRMMNTMSLHLNFTPHSLTDLILPRFEVREPLDGQWGVPGEGKNWTGIVGDLQHQQADFSQDITLTSQRAEVVEYCRIYIDESVVILSSKPRPLPEFMSLIRPFEDMLWLLLLVSIMVWGLTLWLLQKAWSSVFGGRGFNFSSALFYSWGIMLEDPPSDPPINISAQMLVGWWLVFCVVITTSYRSSLISHLVVQGKSPLINSMEDLVARQGWSWGTKRMTGALLLFLSTSPYPAVQRVYKGMQVNSGPFSLFHCSISHKTCYANGIDEGLELVLEGDYAFIYSKYYLKTLIATRYTDDSGYTPLHISATEYPLFAGNVWIFRRGTPFRRRLDLAIQRLLEAGLIAFWMDDVIATRVRNTRRNKEEAGQVQGTDDMITFKKDDSQVVLGLHHLQVTFYLLLLGYYIAFVTFVVEYLVHNRLSPWTHLGLVRGSRMWWRLCPCLVGLMLIKAGMGMLTKGRLQEEAGEGVVTVVEGLMDKVGRQVGVMVAEVVKQHLAGCHLVLASSTNNEFLPVFCHIIRYLAAEVEAGLVVMGSLLSQGEPAAHDSPLHDHLLQGLWGDGLSTCHALILDNTGEDTHSTVRFLEWSRLWLRPETSVMVVGGTLGMQDILHHPSLRNTLHAFYFLLHNISSYGLPTITMLRNGGTEKLTQQPEDAPSDSVTVEAYRRCLYCSSGEVDMQLLRRWDLSSGLPKDLTLFPQHPENFMGHMFKVVAKNYFPYISYETTSEAPGAVVSLQDSLNTRMMNTMAFHLNFTYEVREPQDGQWGVPGEGDNWTGIVGDLQHQQADFSMDLTLTPKRAEVVEYCRVYIDESVVILSSKPRPLPEFMSLIRPFEEMLWLLLLVSIVGWGTTLWLLQKAWSWVSGGRGLNLSSSLFYSWGIMLEDPPNDPPKNITAQVLVGWWLVFSLVVTTAYRSSLISHLVVQGKSPVINSMEDLVARQGWNWGTPRMTGALLLVLSTSPYPAVQKVYKEMQSNSLDEGLELVLQGGYSFIYSKYYCRTLIATRYTDSAGYTPIHISATEYPLFAGNGLAFRRGAPFRRQLDIAIQRLLEGGLITFWMDDVIATRVRNTRRSKKEEAGQVQGTDDKLTFKKDGGQVVVLGLHHLQVTFYLMLLGYDIALVTFVVECLVHTRL
ncbi:uncharacterized protein [Panulirus ornatus]|uniref:uncharacterized protein n=1 Tax=Panulirus ornatus TaxID=150431 RepID=UPI003A8B3EE3